MRVIPEKSVQHRVEAFNLSSTLRLVRFHFMKRLISENSIVLF